ncbi:TolC family protein [Terrimonas rubra]|uniref:TolC family protein n=1 Tax=Terrimonas rubra TaxID=1035890 RepID=A0ABW6A1Y9_9BACT
MITVFRSKPKLLLFIFLLPVLVQAQNSLDGYIDSALTNNRVLQQKNISLEKATLALSIAKSYYYPNLGFQAGYQTAAGGRDINLPLGDLLNGVYGTLNQLTGSNNFPQLKNQQVNFLPKNFYDAKLRTTMPLYNQDIYYNKKIAHQQIALSELDIDVYKRELIKNVKEAYYNYLTALQAIDIYKQALEIANESKRVNQKLLDNGKGLHAYILRSESEIENINAQINAAEQQSANAMMYFNFLLNRPLRASISTDYPVAKNMEEAGGLLLREYNNSSREEITLLDKVVQLNETAVAMNKSAYYPKLNSFLDLGSQAENFKFNSQSRYYMLGLQLDVPIFTGFRTKNKVKQAELDVANAKINKAQVAEQLNLAGSVAKNNLLAAWQTYTATTKQLEAAAAYQRLIDRGYKEGTNTFIETVDARGQFTQAQLAHNIQQYKVLIAAAVLEREAATIPLKTN